MAKMIVRTFCLAALLVAGLAAGADAQGYYGPPGFRPYPFRYGFRPYGYGFRPYGYGYGFRRYGYGFPPRLSYGTGYHGRGTRTGGPVGGLPNRN